MSLHSAAGPGGICLGLAASASLFKEAALGIVQALIAVLYVSNVLCDERLGQAHGCAPKAMHIVVAGLALAPGHASCG